MQAENVEAIEEEQKRNEEVEINDFLKDFGYNVEKVDQKNVNLEQQ